MLRITKNTKRDNCVWLLSERDKKMNKKLAFYVLFSNHQIAKLKYKKRRKILNTILFGLIQQQEIWEILYFGDLYQHHIDFG